MLKPGWLNRQFEKVKNDVKDWPDWMKREAGLDIKYDTTSAKPVPKEKAKDQSNK
jgi:hypothetical protein